MHRALEREREETSGHTHGLHLTVQAALELVSFSANWPQYKPRKAALEGRSDQSSPVKSTAFSLRSQSIHKHLVSSLPPFNVGSPRGPGLFMNEPLLPVMLKYTSISQRYAALPSAH
jgi:hypothetical protein